MTKLWTATTRHGEELRADSAAGLVRSSAAKRQQAERCAFEGDVARAWALYDEIGDRASARQMLLRCQQPKQHCAKLEKEAQVEAPRHIPSLMKQAAAIGAHLQFAGTGDARTQVSSRECAGTQEQQPPGLVPSSRPSSSQSSSHPIDDLELSSFVAGLRRTLAVNRRTIGKVDAIFAKWDRDSSGALTKEEFADALQQVRPTTTAEEISAMFRLADKDDDGYIEKQEFVEWLMHA